MAVCCDMPYRISPLIRQTLSPSKTSPKISDGSRFLRLFRKGKIRIIANFHWSDLVICSHSRERTTPSYSRRNTVTFSWTAALLFSFLHPHPQSQMLSPCKRKNVILKQQTLSSFREANSTTPKIISLRKNGRKIWKCICAP